MAAHSELKALITGGAGFIGRRLVEVLPDAIEILVLDCLDRQTHRSSPDFPARVSARAVCIRSDVRDVHLYQKALEGLDVVVHLAAQTGTGQSMYELSRYVQHNADGTARLLEALSSLRTKPRRLILASSRAVYGEGRYADGDGVRYPSRRRLQDLRRGSWEVQDDAGRRLVPLPMEETQPTSPVSIYGLTKLWQEQLAQAHCASIGIESVALRLQNVYGPGQEPGNPYTGIMGVFARSILQEDRAELFEDGLMTRDFVFVDDVADAIARCMFHEGPLPPVVNVGSGRATTLKEVVDIMARLLARDATVALSGHFRLGDIRHATASMDRFREALGEWSPTPLEDGMKRYLHWFLQQSREGASAFESSLRQLEEKGLLLRSEPGKRPPP